MGNFYFCVLVCFNDSWHTNSNCTILRGKRIKRKCDLMRTAKNSVLLRQWSILQLCDNQHIWFQAETKIDSLEQTWLQQQYCVGTLVRSALTRHTHVDWCIVCLCGVEWYLFTRKYRQLAVASTMDLLPKVISSSPYLSIYPLLTICWPFCWLCISSFIDPQVSFNRSHKIKPVTAKIQCLETHHYCPSPFYKSW